MTAIAYRDGVMAADTQTNGGGMVCGHAKKIARNRETGAVGAAAGHAGLAEEFRRWVRSGRIDEWIASGFAERLPLSENVNEFGAIVATVDGRVIRVDHCGRPNEIDAPFHVEGSAEQILMGAMAAGASAEEAVRIATRYDVYSGGEIQVERLGVTGPPDDG